MPHCDAHFCLLHTPVLPVYSFVLKSISLGTEVQVEETLPKLCVL